MRLDVAFLRFFLVLMAALFATLAIAADVVPYSVKSIKAVGPGFVELVGPGKIQVNDEVLDYDGTKYISVENIDSMTSVTGVSKGCLLSYSSEGYTENISVREQSRDEVVAILNEAK